MRRRPHPSPAAAAPATAGRRGVPSPVLAPAADELECLVEAARPNADATRAAWRIVMRFASERGWVLHGGWAVHLFLASVDPALGLYDASRPCTTGDFDVMCVDPLADLAELATRVQADTGLPMSVMCTARPNSFVMRGNYGGTHFVDAWQVAPAVLAALPTRVYPPSADGGLLPPLRALDPHLELVKLHYAMTNVFMLPSFDISGRAARLAALEAHLLCDASVRSACAGVAAAPDSSGSGRGSSRGSRGPRQAAAAAMLAGGLGEALRWGEAGLVGACADAPTTAPAPLLEVAVQRELFAEVCAAALAALAALGAGHVASLHDAFSLCVGPMYICSLELGRVPAGASAHAHAPACACARIYCHVAPVPCVPGAERPDGLAACTPGFGLAHLAWLALWKRGAPEGSRARRDAARALCARLREPGALRWRAVYDAAHFAGRAPVPSVMAQWHAARARGRASCIQYRPATRPGAVGWRAYLAQQRRRGAQEVRTFAFEGARLGAPVAAAAISQPAALRAFLAGRLPNHTLTQPLLDEPAALSSRKRAESRRHPV